MPTPALPKSYIQLTSQSGDRFKRSGESLHSALTALKTARGKSDPAYAAISALLARVETLEAVLRTPQTISAVSLSYEDLDKLSIGQPFGPTRIDLYSGPPDHVKVGWLGSAISANLQVITSMTAGTGVWTTTAPHGLATGDRIYLTGASSPNWKDGSYLVASTPSATTLTTTSLVTTASTGGTLQKIFVGIYGLNVYDTVDPAA